jgi:hypothetical protein
MSTPEASELCELRIEIEELLAAGQLQLAYLERLALVRFPGLDETVESCVFFVDGVLNPARSTSPFQYAFRILDALGAGPARREFENSFARSERMSQALAGFAYTLSSRSARFEVSTAARSLALIGARLQELGRQLAARYPEHPEFSRIAPDVDAALGDVAGLLEEWR